MHKLPNNRSLLQCCQQLYLTNADFALLFSNKNLSPSSNWPQNTDTLHLKVQSSADICGGKGKKGDQGSKQIRKVGNTSGGAFLMYAKSIMWTVWSIFENVCTYSSQQKQFHKQFCNIYDLCTSGDVANTSRLLLSICDFFFQGSIFVCTLKIIVYQVTVFSSKFFRA